MGFVPADAATKGGYARPLTPEEQAEQAKMVAEHLKSQDIVVTTAQIPGRKAPRIVTAEMVKSMKPGRWSWTWRPRAAAMSRAACPARRSRWAGSS